MVGADEGGGAAVQEAVAGQEEGDDKVQAQGAQKALGGELMDDDNNTADANKPHDDAAAVQLAGEGGAVNLHPLSFLFHSGIIGGEGDAGGDWRTGKYGQHHGEDG